MKTITLICNCMMLRAYAVCLLFLVLSVAAEADDGVKTLSIWDCETTGGVKALATENKLVKQGNAAVHWRNHPQNPKFNVPDVPQDWRGYDLLRIWIHNAKAVPTRFMIVVQSENDQTEGMDYWSYSVKLDFLGWKELIFPVGEKSRGQRSPRGWDQVDGIFFTASGWANEPHPDADVVIDDIRLQSDPPRPGPRMSDPEFFAELDLSRDDLQQVRDAVNRGDLDEAKSALLTHMRNRSTPRWWFNHRDRPTVVGPVTGGSDGWDYFVTQIKIDWTGWKQCTFPLEQWRRSRSPIGWQHINSLAFSSSYGDRTPSADTILVLDDVKLTGDEPVAIGDFEHADDFGRWRSLVPTTKFVKEGSQAALWANLPVHNGIGVSDIPRDWRGFQALQFWAYSAKATNDVITITADSDTPPAVADAEQILQHIYDGYDLGDDIDWRSNKYDPSDPAFTREWTYGLNRFGTWKQLGRAYWATGDEKYAREWIAQMRDWVQDNRWPLWETGNKTLTWRTIEAGIRTADAWPDSLAYFLSSPSLTGDDLVMFLKSWIEHAHHLMRITLDHPTHGGNWVTMECNGLGHLGLMLPECKDAALWLKTATDRLTMELDRQVYPDGAQKELTPSYHEVARRNFAGLYKFAQQNQTPLPSQYLHQLERMYEYLLKAMTPEGRLPPLNDSSYVNALGSLGEGAELFDRDDFRWAATGGAEGNRPDYTSVAFPYAGQYVMRSGWDHDAKYLLFESGPFGIGHQHEDKLSMFLYAHGRPLLTEAGTYSYDQSKYRKYVLGSWSHNTVLVDGQQQHRRGREEMYETDRPLDNLWIHNDVFDAADGVYESGYGTQQEIAATHERTVVFVRPDYWVVFDRINAEGSHQYDVLWHLNNDIAESDSDTLAAWGSDEGVANLLVTPATKQGLSLEIVTGRDEPVLGFAPARRKKPIPVLDYKVDHDGTLTIAWILTPYIDARPELTAELQQRNGWTVVRVSHSQGTDSIGIAARGQTNTLTLKSGQLAGHVAVIRYDADGRMIVAKAQ